MRNYVIINGVNSLTKNGLAIKDLPPITKTMMRTLREEIDGRDGDIITELGYSAYDKSMTIGLFGTGYDIDDIIAFFNQSGTIVFSNEPDKFYNFKIIDQIDYNKLLKFKEATIRFHCHPFKYPLNEVPLIEEFQYVEATGSDVTLDNTAAGIFNKIDLLGNTKQTQYTGKNKFNYLESDFQSSNKGTCSTSIPNTIVLTCTETTSNNNLFYRTKIDDSRLTNGTTYSISYVGDSNVKQPLRLQLRNKNGSNAGLPTGNSITYDSTYSLYVVGNPLAVNNSTEVTAGTTCTIKNLMVRPSSITDTTYEPYVGGIPSPNPEYPQDIHVVSGNNIIKIQNKNVLDLSNGISTGTNSGITITKQSDNTYTFIGTASSITPDIWILGSYGNWNNYSNWESFDKSKIIHTLEPDTYTIKDVAIFYIYEDGTKSNVAPTIGNKSTFTITKTAHIVAVRAPVMVNGVTYNTIIYPQLERGSEATPYEKGVTQSFPINLGNLEMVSIPNTDYKDTFVKIDGVWYKRESVEKKVLDGSETWTMRAGGRVSIDIPSQQGEYVALGLSNKFKNVNSWDEHNATNYSFIVRNGNWGQNLGRISFIDRDFTTAAEWEQFLASDNVIVYFQRLPQLGGAIDIPIESETLADQLEAIKNAVSYEGQTNITQTNNDLPFILDLSALELNSDHLVINNIGNIYSKPTLDLEGTGIVDVYLNDIQMFEVDLTENNEIIINTDEMEAFNPETGALANRQVTGEYDVFKLDSGENDLRFSGNLTKATVTNYERWL